MDFESISFASLDTAAGLNIVAESQASSAKL
jgi:hypothetical protein